MVIFLFPVIVYAFLLLGSLVFAACVVAPPARRFALSAAFWCAVWGPGVIGFLLLGAVLAELGVETHDFLVANGDSAAFLSLKPWAVFGWGYFTVGALVTAVAATVASWAHQKLVRRFTFALFRLYAAGVCAGIGSVFGISLGILIAWQTGWMRDAFLSYFAWGAGTMILMALFAVTGYKNAARLRGPAPTTFTWITPEEFAGTNAGSGSARE